MAWSDEARKAALEARRRHAKPTPVATAVPHQPRVIQVKAGWSKSLPNNYQLPTPPRAAVNPMSSAALRQNRNAIKSYRDSYGRTMLKMQFHIQPAPYVKKSMEPGKAKTKHSKRR